MAILATIALSSSATAQAPRQTGTASTTTVLAIPATGFRDNTPVGIFYRLKVGFSSGSRIDVNTLAFLPGNRVTRTYPFGGGDSFDQQKRCNPDMCASYRAGENTISIRWDNNQASDYTYRRTDDGFELDGDSYRPVRTFTRATLVGTWSGAASTPASLASIEGDIYRRQ